MATLKSRVITVATTLPPPSATTSGQNLVAARQLISSHIARRDSTWLGRPQHSKVGDGGGAVKGEVGGRDRIYARHLQTFAIPPPNLTARRELKLCSLRTVPTARARPREDERALTSPHCRSHITVQLLASARTVCRFVPVRLPCSHLPRCLELGLFRNCTSYGRSSKRSICSPPYQSSVGRQSFTASDCNTHVYERIRCSLFSVTRSAPVRWRRASHSLHSTTQ